MNTVKKILIGCGILFVLLFIAALFTEDETKPTATAQKATTKPEEAGDAKKQENTSAKTGDSVSTGNFTYKVEGVDFKKSIGSDYAKQIADGMYMIVKISIKNTDKESRTLDNPLFKLISPDGTEYESSTNGTTALEMSGKSSIFLKQCQPNIETRGYLVFEVPEKKVGYHLNVSNGFLSGKTENIAL